VPESPLISRRAFLTRSAAVGAVVVGAGSLREVVGVATSGAERGAVHDVIRVAIHPSIGVARVGNASDLFFFGPEVPGTLPTSRAGFKDDRGAIARQAARFRVYGLDRRGRVVRELTARDADITWRVDAANSKAAWYTFDTAFDLPIAMPVPRRNASVVGDARHELVVSAGASVRGPGAKPVALRGGSFLGDPVDLGELLTDGHGRLVVLPADGRGFSPNGSPLMPSVEDDNWTDNVCDGPVRATVRLGDRVLEAAPAWLLVTPPNYAPAVGTGLVTAYDAARSGLVEGGLLDEPTLSFAEDVLPIFARMVDMQWVNAGYLERSGPGGPEDWLAPKLLERLADPSRSNRAWRRALFRRVRDPSFAAAEPDALPSIYGDGVPPPATNNWQMLAVTPLQYRFLRTWAEDPFHDDRRSTRPVTRVEELPVGRQPAALDRAALESCLGGAFRPGIEAPWTLRVPSLWSGAYQLCVRSTTPLFDDYGPELTRQVALGTDGPLHGSAPGDLTRWLGVPWQSDAASCRSGYEVATSRVLPAFWPARIPSHVLSEADYQIVIDAGRPMRERRAAFRRRRDWERFVARGNDTETLDLMMRDWSRLGVVTLRPGPDDGAFPSPMKVETGVGFPKEPVISYGPNYQPYPPGSP
jgi:L-Lysine epsilon oxidase N-terminal/L-lysine epsilon oxidase C-terminal domain